MVDSSVRRSRRFGLLGLVAVLALVFPALLFAGGQGEKSAASSAPSASTSATISLWAWGRLPERFKNQVAPVFSKEYPNVKYDFVTMNESDIIQKIQVLVSSNSPVPDIIGANDYNAPIYMSHGLVVPLNKPTQLINMKDFVPYKVANSSWDGVVYGVPHDPAPAFRIFRTDLYQKAGVDPASVKTWADFIAAGKKLLKDGVYAIELPRDGVDYGTFNIVLGSLGGQLYNTQHQLAIDSPQTREALQIIKEMKQAGIWNDWGTTGSSGDTRTPALFAAIQQGKLATIINASWYIGSITSAVPTTSGDWGFMPLPTGSSGKQYGTFNGGSGFYIVKGHKTSKALLVDFLKVFAKQQLAIFEDSGIFTAYIPNYSNPIFQKPFPFFGGGKYYDFVLKESEAVPPGIINYTPTYNQDQSVIPTIIGPYVDGQATLDATMTKLVQQLKAIGTGM